MHNVPAIGTGRMLRRTVLLTAVAVAISAAGAFAVVPSLANVRRSLGGLWSHGFTPVPHPRHAADSAADVLLDNTGGASGTYCPVKPHDSGAALANPDQRHVNESRLDSGATIVPSDKNDLLQPPPSANCTVPESTPSNPRSIRP